MPHFQISKRCKVSHIVCNTCHTKFRYVRQFIDHIHIHNGTKPYKCSACGVYRHTRVALRAHKYHNHRKGFEIRKAVREEKLRLMIDNPQAMVHENPFKKFRCEKHFANTKLKCEHCDKEFIRKSRLVYHMRTHTGESPFKCDQCGKGFKMSCRLNHYIQAIHGDHIYKCSQCDGKFKSHDLYTYHQYVHTGYPFKCNGMATRKWYAKSIDQSIHSMHKGCMTKEKFDELYPNKERVR